MRCFYNKERILCRWKNITDGKKNTLEREYDNDNISLTRQYLYVIKRKKRENCYEGENY